MKSIAESSFILFGVNVKCHVLDNGERVIEEQSMIDLFQAMGNDTGAGDDFDKFLDWIGRRE